MISMNMPVQTLADEHLPQAAERCVVVSDPG
jgi:hypothetical protein